jgi:hypothetical protein
MNKRGPIDERLVEWTPWPPIELAPGVLDLRRVVEDAGRRLLTVRDDRLEAVWPWRGSDAEVEVRYGFYRLIEGLEAGRAKILRARIGAQLSAPPGAVRGASATAARWALHGRLLPLADEDLDRDPGHGEWTIRETLGHVLSSQRSYGRYTAWWLTQAPTPGAPIPDELVEELPERLDEAAGSVSDVRAQLDDLLDLSMARLGPVETLSVPARWSGGESTVGFRIGRWASHIHEHTIQVEKTLAMLDRELTETERLVALLFAAYGRVEELVFGLTPADLAKSSGGDGPASTTLTEIAEEIPEIVAEVVVAANANVRPQPAT